MTKTVRPKAWRNSDLGPREARKQGKCGACGGTGRYQQTINGKQRLSTCRTCNGNGKA